MKTIIMLQGSMLLSAMLLSAFSCKLENSINNTESEKSEVQEPKLSEMSDRTYFIALVYVKEGMEGRFQEYHEKVTPYIEKYGGKVERLLKPTQVMKGALELPTEVHLVSFVEADGFQKMLEDEGVQKIIPIRDEALDKVVFMPCKSPQMSYEKGDSSKLYFLAFMNFKEGFEPQFRDYQQQAGTIIKEFGAHFERLLNPIDMKGEFQMPDEIHIAYFDSEEGPLKMGEDPRMQKIFPLRDEALSRLDFVVAKAID